MGTSPGHPTPNMNKPTKQHKPNNRAEVDWARRVAGPHGVRFPVGRVIKKKETNDKEVSWALTISLVGF